MVAVPDEWQKILFELKAQDDSTVLAGGALRDLWCGKKVKDLDFFSNKMVDYPGAYAMRLAHEEYNVPEVAVVRECRRYSKPSIQLITHHRQTLQDTLNSFDFGLCQIAWDGYRYHHTQYFLDDFLHGKFTLRNVVSLEKSKMRYARFAKRYKGFPMEISGHAHYTMMMQNFAKHAPQADFAW